MADLRPLLLGAVLLATAACAGGDPTGGLSDSAAVMVSDTVAVDLETGAVEAASVGDDVALAQQRWRDRWMLFRRLGPAHGPQTRWVGVFEVTQAQWRRLGGEQVGDWPAGLVHEDGALPATGIVPVDARDALARMRLRAFRLRLPNGAEWLQACGAGTGAYAWGDSAGDQVARAYAVYRRDGEPCALRRVGSLVPNANGCFDIHGNAWELVDDGADGFHARGGAFDSPIESCTAAQVLPLAGSLAHPAVGLRLILVP